jgi:UDP-N-acetylglucosamine--N-acetylmuramyl-(pentapeptide) pyrophosphoryl-undecaprenol N-acetylglucosamine transferase
MSVLQALTEAGAWNVLWVGGQGGIEEDLVKRAGIAFESIPAAGVHGVGLRRLPGNLARLGRGYLAARRVIQRFNPDVMLFTGGYVGVPVGLAGRHIPSLVYVPDIEPGLALQVLARFAWKVAVTTSDSRKYFKGQRRVVVTGYPVRQTLAGWELEAARTKLHLDTSLFTLLVVGGSTGARSINQAIFKLLPALLPQMQILHLTGRLDWPEAEAVKKGLPSQLSDAALASRYHAYPYLHEDMGAALAAADLAVSRAGASTLGEFPLFGLPAVLIPYPHAWRYQQVNASWLAQRGAACILMDAELIPRLQPVLLDLAQNPLKLQAMRHAMQSLAQPGAARSIASLLSDLADQKGRKGS